MAQVELQGKHGRRGDLLVAALEGKLEAFSESKFFIGRHGRSVK